MYELKTKVNNADVHAFLSGIENIRRREDSFFLLDMMREISGVEPKMWGDSIVGFGSWHYRYASGQEGDTARIGFSPRKTSLSIYVLNAYEGPEPLLERLGKHKAGVSCLYVNKLSDVDLDVLRELVRKAWGDGAD